MCVCVCGSVSVLCVCVCECDCVCILLCRSFNSFVVASFCSLSLQQIPLPPSSPPQTYTQYAHTHTRTHAHAHTDIYRLAPRNAHARPPPPRHPPTHTHAPPHTMLLCCSPECSSSKLFLSSGWRTIGMTRMFCGSGSGLSAGFARVIDQSGR